MINLFNSNYNKQYTKKTKKVKNNTKNGNNIASDNNTTTLSNASNLNNLNNLNNLKKLNKKSFIKKIKYSAKQRAKLKKHKVRSVESYCKAFHRIDILGNVNKNLYNSCKYSHVLP